MGPGEVYGVTPLRDVLIGDGRPALFALTGAVLFVLLIACVNVANPVIARGTERMREVAVRAALGPGRLRIIVQLLGESVVLALAGGVLGLTLSHFGMRMLLAITPGNLPRLGAASSTMAFDSRVLIFMLAVSVITGCLFGIVPSWNASRTNLSAVFSAAGSQPWYYWRAQACSSRLLSKCIMPAAASTRATSSPSKCRCPPPWDYVSSGRFIASTSLAPGLTVPFSVVGRELLSAFHGTANWQSISPHYFDVMRIRLVRGRVFTHLEAPGTKPVVIVNETMARKYWGRGDPIGQRLLLMGRAQPGSKQSALEVVGVVADVRETGLDRDPAPTLYVPIAQVPDTLNALTNRNRPLTWAIRTTANPLSLRQAIERELQVANPSAWIARVRTMDQIVAESTARARFNVTLLSLFALIAVVLAGIGLYGLMSYSVEQRRREIGIRMAIGAMPGDVGNMILAEALRLVTTGLVIGAMAALSLTRVLESLVYGSARGTLLWRPVLFCCSERSP